MKMRAEDQLRPFFIGESMRKTKKTIKAKKKSTKRKTIVPSYKLTNLNLLGTTPNTILRSLAINNYGQVVGTRMIDGIYRAFLWQPNVKHGTSGVTIALPTFSDPKLDLIDRKSVV
jgi:probable HAF family extracellular repeat protein